MPPGTQAKALVFVAAAALVAGGLSASAPLAPDEDGKARVTVLYVGADDCAPCKTWRREQFPRFRDSSEISRLTYREVTSPNLFDVLKDDYWPDDLRQYRKTLDKNSPVPVWFIVVNDDVALKVWGLRQWEEVALPRIRSLVR
jgi:hypothetical protein